MNRNTGIVLTLTVGLLVSSGVLASNLANAERTSEPAKQSVEQAVPVTPSAPLFLVTSSSPFSNLSGKATWLPPVGDITKVNYYLVIFKEEGKADRYLTTPYTFIALPELDENTTYTVEVMAEVTSMKTGENIVTPVASSLLNTETFFGSQ